MPDDYSLMRTWDLVEMLSNDAAVDIVETDCGLDFQNYFGEVIDTIFIAGTVRSSP